MHSEATDRQVLENDLRQALERSEMTIAYQPIVRAASEEISGFEALVRWNHPLARPDLARTSSSAWPKNAG